MTWHKCLNGEDARGYGSSFTSLWQLWSQSQHGKDWGSVEPAYGKSCNEPTITVIWQRLQVVDKFIQLGSTLAISNAMRTRCFHYYQNTGSPFNNFLQNSEGYIFEILFLWEMFRCTSVVVSEITEPLHLRWPIEQCTLVVRLLPELLKPE